MLVKSDIRGVFGHEEAVYKRADHRVFEVGGGWYAGQGTVPQTWVLGCGTFWLAQPLWWDGGCGCRPTSESKSREQSVKEAIGRGPPGHRGLEERFGR